MVRVQLLSLIHISGYTTTVDGSVDPEQAVLELQKAELAEMCIRDRACAPLTSAASRSSAV